MQKNIFSLAILAWAGCAGIEISPHHEQELTRAIAVQENAPDFQGLTTFPMCRGHGYLVMSTEENDEYSYVRMYRYKESRTTFEVDESNNRGSRFDRDGHIAGLAIASLHGEPVLYFVNFQRRGTDDGVVAYTPLYNAVTDEHEYEERQGRRVIHAHEVTSYSDRLNRGSGLAARDTVDGPFLLVTRWWPAARHPLEFTSQKSESQNGEVKEFKITKREDPRWRAWSQGVDFADPEGKFLIHTANGLGFSWIDIYATEPAGDPLFTLRYERHHRRQWIEEPAMTAGGWMLLPFEKVDKLVGWPPDKLIFVLEGAYPAKSQSSSQAEFLAVLRAKARTLPDTLPTDFVPFPWEPRFWDGGPEMPCYDRIVELRRVWSRGRVGVPAESPGPGAGAALGATPPAHVR